MFGTKVRAAMESFSAYRRPLDMGGNDEPHQALAKTIVQIAISLAALVWGTILILGVGTDNDELRLTAAGWVGVVIGYWMG